MTETAIQQASTELHPLLAAFQAATRAPYYQRLLANHGVDPAAIQTVEDFHRQVPLTDKASVFGAGHPVTDLWAPGGLETVKEIMVSSGYSGANSYGVSSTQESALIQQAIDGALGALFGADDGRLLLINGFGMGIQVRTAHSLCATGPRPDLMLAMVAEFSPLFDQTLILGDPHLLKQVVDDGNDRDIDWEANQVSFLSGQDWLPETLRSYLCAETGIDPDRPGGRRKYLQTMGLTELGLMLFLESECCVQLRRMAYRDAAFRTQLLGVETAETPSIFHYDPRRFHIESSPHASGPRLVCTALSPLGLIPMIRYLTGDLGGPIDDARIAPVLAAAKVEPTFPLPFAWSSGRLGAAPPGTQLHAGLVRERLYSDIPSARQLTGNFRLSTEGDGQALIIQLRPGYRPTPQSAAALESLIADVAPRAAAIRLQLLSFADYPAPPFLDYERKFRHGP
jgi:phenylacetate-CoA ligase